MDTADAPGLLRQHRRLTSRLASRIGRSEAEDLASEALTRGLRRPAPDGRQAPWIERIFHNLVIDRGRRAGRIAASVANVVEDPIADSPEDALLAREREGALLGAIPTIPSPLRDALVARFYEDRDYDGVAATRGITVATARTRVHRALARLRVSLGRLRATVPAPFAFGTKSITAALMPAVLSAGLVIPSLADPGPASAVRGARSIVLAQSRSASARREAKARPESASIAESPVSTGETAATPAATAPQAPATRRASARAPSSNQGGAEAGSEGGKQDGKEGGAGAVQRFNYDNDEVLGDLMRPGTDPVFGDPGRAKHVSLIEIPRSFAPAITKMLEDI